jgi:D-alanyl-D-alanine carboxypeptidase
MSRSAKIFVAVFLISLPFWVGINLAEKELSNLFFWSHIANNPEVFSAQALQEKIFEMLPMQKAGTEDITIEGDGVITLFGNEEGNVKVLFGQNENQPLPIASLTKLMTALVAVKHFNLEENIRITSQAIREEGTSGFLRVGDIFTVRELLAPLLIESSNDAAAALAQSIGRKAFIELMNLEAEQLNLADTYFVNPTGLDPDNPGGPLNYASPADLALLLQYIVTDYPQISEVLAIQQADLYTQEGIFHHTMKSTNALLSYIGWPTTILGGKTGWTPLAQESLALVLKGPKEKGHVIHIVLGSSDRFGETKKLADWIYKSFNW